MKNAHFYQIKCPIEIVEEELLKATETPLGQLELMRWSWDKWEENDHPILEVMGFRFLKVRLQERLLPASVINDFLSLKISELETAEDRKVGRKERSEIKDSVIDSLLPRSFIKTSFVNVVLNEKEGLVIVDTSSGSVADEVIALLRSCSKTLPVLPFSKIFDGVSSHMTKWLSEPDTRPQGIAPCSKFRFDINMDVKGSVSANGVESDSITIDNLLREGHAIKSMQLHCEDIGTFVLSNKLVVSGFKPLENAVEEDPEDIHANRILRANSVVALAKLISTSFPIKKQEKMKEEESELTVA